MAFKVLIAFSLLFCGSATKDEVPHESKNEEFVGKENWFEEQMCNFGNYINSINSLVQMAIYLPLVTLVHIINAVISLLAIWFLLTMVLYPIIFKTPNVIHTIPCNNRSLDDYEDMDI